MAELREPLLGVAVGKKGCGKTFTTEKMLKQYVMGNPSAGVAPRRVLIFDVNDEFQDVKALKLSDVYKFSLHPKIEIRRIRPFNENGTVMGNNDLINALDKILYNFRSGLLLIEDINKYLSDYLPQDLIGRIVSARHADLDIITHFQSIGRVSPKIWQNINWIRFHKISDFVLKHEKKFENYLEMFLIVEAYVNKEYNEGNQRVYVYVNIDKEKILTNDKSKFESVIENYLIENQKRILVPMTQKNILRPKDPPLTLNQALIKKKEALMLQYF